MWTTMCHVACGTLVEGHKVETKTVHITDPSLDILTWKPHFHANVKVRGMTEEENLVIIYLTV